MVGGGADNLEGAIERARNIMSRGLPSTLSGISSNGQKNKGEKNAKDNAVRLSDVFLIANFI